MVVAPLALSGTNYSTTSRHGSETLPSLCLPLVYNSPRRIRSPCALGPTWQPSNTARSNFFFAREEGKFKALRFASLWNALVREENRPPVFRCISLQHLSDQPPLYLSLSLSPRLLLVPFPPLSWVRMRRTVCRYRSVLRTIGCGSKDRFWDFDRVTWSLFSRQCGVILCEASFRRILFLAVEWPSPFSFEWTTRRIWKNRWTRSIPVPREKSMDRVALARRERDSEEDRKILRGRSGEGSWLSRLCDIPSSWRTWCTCYHRSSSYLVGSMGFTAWLVELKVEI